MRFKKLDLNLLVALDHMITLRSVSAAAEKMFMSQSAMSNALNRLRDYFDDPLLVQVGKRMELTPRAESMQAAVRDILVRIEATIDRQPDYDPTVSNREFNITVSDYTLRVLAPHISAMAERQGAKARINFRPQTGAPHVMLERGDIDLLICPEMFISDEHPSALLFEDHYVATFWSEGPYAGREITREVFEQARHVAVVPNSSSSAPAEESILRAAGVQRNVDQTTFSFATLPHMLVGTSRIATVHGNLARAVSQYLPLAFVPLPFEVPPFRQMIQWHSFRDQDPAISWLRETVFRAAEKIQPN